MPDRRHKRIKRRPLQKCPACQGRGWFERAGRVQRCGRCRGAGSFRR